MSTSIVKSDVLEAPLDERHYSPQSPSDRSTTVIAAGSDWRILDVGELWRYRELLCFLIWRDIAVRYKQTVLGAAWAVVQPLAVMFALSMFVNRTTDASEGAVPYPLFVLAGLLPWFFFANTVTSAAQSIVSNQSLVTKVYFPRILIPIAAGGAGLVDFGISFVLLIAAMLFYGVMPGPGIVMLPVIVVLLLLCAFSTGALLSALTVAYRDFRHAVTFMMQFWMFATPAIYLAGKADDVQPWWLSLNPMQAVIANFRGSLLGGPIDWGRLGVTAVIIVTLVFVAGLYFRRVERNFADLI